MPSQPPATFTNFKPNRSTLKNLLKRIKAQKTSLSAISLGVLGALSFGTPGFAHHDTYRELYTGLGSWEYKKHHRLSGPAKYRLGLDSNFYPHPNGTIPICSPFQNRNNGRIRPNRSVTPSYLGWQDGRYEENSAITNSPNHDYEYNLVYKYFDLYLDIGNDNLIRTAALVNLRYLSNDGEYYLYYRMFENLCHTLEGNSSPTVIKSIPDMVLTIPIGEKTIKRTINLNEIFEDPDGDALTYRATSSDPGNVSVAVSGNTLTVTVVANGTSTITVTADDGKGGTTDTSFTVQPTNNPPITTGSIPNQTFLPAGADTVSNWCNLEEDTKFSTNISSLFEDPDGDDLTYEVTGERSWITASISGDTLNINALEKAVTGDSTTITVTASDGKDDGDASLSFNVNIVAEKTPKPILSKNSISLSLAEVLPDQPTPIAQDSYSVTLSCQYRFPVTVEITDTTGGVLQIGPTNLTFNQTNWDVPQTVRVRTVGPVPAGDITFQEFDLPHAATTTTSEDKTVRESGDDLGITLRYERLEDDMDDDMEDDTDDETEELSYEEKLQQAMEKIKEQQGEERQQAKDELSKELADIFGPPLQGAVDGALKGGLTGVVVGGPAGGVAGAASGAIGGFISGGIEVIVPALFESSLNHDGEKEFNRLAENLYIHQEALQNGTISLDQAFSGQSFSFPFSLSQASAEDQDTSASPRFNALLSSGVNFSSFSDIIENMNVDGSTTTYGLGIDVLPNPDVPLLTGLQLAFTRSHSNLEREGLEASYKLEMFSVHPSVIWDATDSLTVWASLGYGRPTTEFTFDSIADLDIDASHTSSGDFFSVAGGANYRVWQSDASALSINLSGSTTTILDNDFQQGSIAAQFAHDFTFNSGQLNSSAGLVLLLSDSDPSTTELSGSLNWLPTQGRLSGSTNARLLLFGGDRSEWGIGGSVLLLPRQQGEGLSLSLQPSFGQSSPSITGINLDSWSFTDPTELALSTTPLTARFNAEVAYGFRTGNHSLLTPYIDASLAHGSNTYTTGLRYEMDTGLDLDLSASQRQRSSGNNENRLFLQLRSDL